LGQSIQFLAPACKDTLESAKLCNVATRRRRAKPIHERL
jgi:hypothetical protein